MMTVRTNVWAMFAHRNMMLHQKMMNRSLMRLSTGLRINSAADDAAGLAISERMRGQIRGLHMASRNAQDAISMLQTAEGGLNETQAILHRMRELAVQAANGTYNAEDRELINKEYQALLDEIDRISNSTHYNGINLLNGSAGGEKGADRLDKLGLDASMFSMTGTFEGQGKLTVSMLDDGSALFSLQTGNETVTYKHSGVGDVAFTLKDGSEIKLTGVDASKLKNGSVTKIGFDGSGNVSLTDVLVADGSDKTYYQIGANGGSDQQMGVHLNDMSSGSLGRDTSTALRDTSILTRENAKDAIAVIDSATKQVNMERAGIGASINRLYHTINSLDTAAENLTAAESRIRDADMAEEMMNFVKYSILMQAAQAMMAQAMKMPETILVMLQSL